MAVMLCALTARPLAASGTLPGRVLPIQPDLPTAPGTISASHVAPDGSVILRGDFKAVNGIPRPGLVKLTPNGRVDLRFRPAVVVISGKPSGLPFLLWSPAPGDFLGLEDGIILHSFSGLLLAYRPDGRLDPRFDAMRDSGGTVTPLFESNGRLYVRREAPGGSRLEAYRSDTLEPVPMEPPAGWPAPFDQAAPAAAGRLWVLGKQVGGQSNLVIWPPYQPSYTLFRIEADGTLDPSFAPVSLPTINAYTLKPRDHGGFRLVYWDLGRFYLWPSPTSQRYFMDSYDADGQRVASRSVTLPLGVPLVEAEQADGSLVHNVADDFEQFLIRVLPDGAPDPSFRIPLEARSLDRVKDGRLQHSHLKRILSDGTADPSWQTPRLAKDPDISIVGRFDDGGILIREMGAPHSSALMALNHQRQPDGSFRPPPDLPPILSCHIGHDRRSVIVALRGVYDFPDGTQSRLVRLLRDGSMDPESPRYLPTTGFITVFPVGTAPDVYTGGFEVHSLSGGRFLAQYAIDGGDLMRRVLERLLPDGSPDPSFSPAVDRHRIDSIFVLSDDRWISRNALHAANGTLEQALPASAAGAPMLELPDGSILLKRRSDGVDQIIRWHPLSGLDPSFQTAFAEGDGVEQVVGAGDGKLIVSGHFSMPAGAQALVRLHENGRTDPTFRAPPAVRVMPWTPGLRSVIRDGETVPATFTNRSQGARLASMLHLPERQALLVGGNFTRLGLFPRRGLALLSLRRLTTFREWAAALTPQDAIISPSPVNLEDYALGVDPAAVSPERGMRTRSGDAPSFIGPVNPDATDVDLVFEVSENLADWRPVNGNEVEVKHEADNWVLRFPGSSPTLFLRVRYRQTESP